tara:strand:+ start:171 stop:434 length:264 start_codon:yes stop_codon:yes gene_type:complete
MRLLQNWKPQTSCYLEERACLDATEHPKVQASMSWLFLDVHALRLTTYKFHDKSQPSLGAQFHEIIPMRHLEIGFLICEQPGLLRGG